MKKLQLMLLKVKLCQSKNYLKNYTNQILENLKNEKHIHILQKMCWDTDPANMQLISKFNKGIRFLLCF